MVRSEITPAFPSPISELCEILAAGLVRLKVRQSSRLSAVTGESSLDFAGGQSGGRTGFDASETGQHGRQKPIGEMDRDRGQGLAQDHVLSFPDSTDVAPCLEEWQYSAPGARSISTGPQPCQTTRSDGTAIQDPGRQGPDPSKRRSGFSGPDAVPPERQSRRPRRTRQGHPHA